MPDTNDVMTTSSTSALAPLTGAPSLPLPAGRRAILLRYFVTVVCAGSAGAHTALVPEHLGESTPLGLAFAASGLLLAASAMLVGRRRVSLRSMAAAATVLTGVAVAYVLSRTSGLPPLIEAPEQLEAVGVLASIAEIAAAAAVIFLCLDRTDRRDFS